MTSLGVLQSSHVQEKTLCEQVLSCRIEDSQWGDLRQAWTLALVLRNNFGSHSPLIWKLLRLEAADMQPPISARPFPRALASRIVEVVNAPSRL